MLAKFFDRQGLLALFAAAGLAVSATAIPVRAEGPDQAIWLGLKKDVFGDREISEAKDKITLEAPVRAEDAAIVPISIKMPADFAASVKAVTLVVDKNPMPVAATFTYGPAAGNGDRSLSTRIRMDQYSDVRVIAETTDGKLFMTTRFVKASGGCSAPMGKDMDEALKSMGKMQVKTFASKDGVSGLQEAQVMIKHPNNTGMQMDQLTGLYTPARYLDKIEIKNGDELIFKIEGGISISEDPNFRFSFGGKPGDTIQVNAQDTDGAKFTGQSLPSQS
jgi:sulfur-oxidizing protein SoxY